MAQLHRLTEPVTVVVCRGKQKKLECLNVGSILIPRSSPDRDGLIRATWAGLPVLVFQSDLEQRSIEDEKNSLSAVESVSV